MRTNLGGDLPTFFGFKPKGGSCHCHLLPLPLIVCRHGDGGCSQCQEAASEENVMRGLEDLVEIVRAFGYLATCWPPASTAWLGPWTSQQPTPQPGQPPSPSQGSSTPLSPPDGSPVVYFVQQQFIMVTS